MKTRLWIILFLTIIWCGFSNNFHILNIFLGLLFSLLINFMILKDRLDFKISLYHLIILCFYTIWELLKSSIEVAWDILTPSDKSQPKLIKITLHEHHPVAISMIINLISLTPGTLAIDIENESNTLIVHIMFSQNEKNISSFINGQLLEKIMKVIQYA